MAKQKIKVREPRHTEEIQDIIAAAPPWLLKWGITVFFGVLVLIIGLAAFVRYPDVIKTRIKIVSLNAPKPILAKTSGKLVKLLIKDHSLVDQGQVLAYMEATVSHPLILKLSNKLLRMQEAINHGQLLPEGMFMESDLPSLGELQTYYQTFFQSYLNYKSATNSGFYLEKKKFLEKDLNSLLQQQEQLNRQRDLQRRDSILAEQQFEMHQKLAAANVETRAELLQAESQYIAKKSPLIQSEAALIATNINYSAKQKEVLEINNQITLERQTFIQSLNSLISQTEEWKNKYILTASQKGIISYAGVLQENSILNLNQEVFYVSSRDQRFFGEMAIPQDNMGKIKNGQEVLIKLKSFHFEEYGIVHGRITDISEVPYQDSVFMSRVDFKIKKDFDNRHPIILKQGMTADAEILTADATILGRIGRNLMKSLAH